MANKRNLKKDIRYITEIVVVEAIEMSEVTTSEEGRKKALSVIMDVAELHNNLMSRINHPDGKQNKQLVKAYYKEIINDLFAGCNNAYNELNSIEL